MSGVDHNAHTEMAHPPDPGDARRYDWRYLVVSLVMGLAGGGGVSVVAPQLNKSGAIGATDMALLEARVLSEVSKKLEVVRLQLGDDRVPTPTRQRIIHLEREFAKYYPGYKPPTGRFVGR